MTSSFDFLCALSASAVRYPNSFHHGNTETGESFHWLGTLRASALKFVADPSLAFPRLAALKPVDPSKVTEMRLSCLLCHAVAGVKENKIQLCGIGDSAG